MSGTDLLVVGMSHRTSPIAIRERLAVSGPALAQHARALRDGAQLPELLLLSTCNRVEIYVGGEDRERTARALTRWLSDRAGAPVDEFLYVHHGVEAVRHAFRVAASLDSMVVGEPQILGQVKEAYTAAKGERILGTLLDRCFTHAFAVAKRVRSETEIAEGTVSVSSIAGELAKKIFGDLADRRVLLIGAGEMGEAAAKHLRKAGAALTVVNRSLEKAEAVAKENDGQARGLEHLAAELTRADVAIASTASERFVITTELMKGVIKARRHRPLFLIDIAVPRDVDPRVGEMDNVFLYDVDDLEQVAQENLRARQREADAAERIVSMEVAAFEQWRRTGALKPTIVGLRTKVRGVLAGELERSVARMERLSDDDRRALDRMLDAMTNKLLHRAIAELKREADTPEGAALMRATRRLFELEDDGADDGDRAARDDSSESARVSQATPKPSHGPRDDARLASLEPAAERGKAS